MAKLAIKKSTLSQFVGPPAGYLVACVVIAVLVPLGNWWLVLLLVAGAACVLTVWRHIRWPDVWSRYLGFGAVLLLVCVLNHVFYIADFFVAGVQFDQWPFWSVSPQRAVFKGEVITVIGTLLTVYAWYKCGGMSISPAIVLTRHQRSKWAIIFIYALSIAAAGLVVVVPSLGHLSGQLTSALLGLGLVSAFLLPMLMMRRDSYRLIAAIVLSLPFMAMAAVSGMKANIILSLVPAAVMAWRCFHHAVARVGMILCGLAALALITAYVNTYRAEVWIPQSRGGIASQTVPSDFIDEVRTTGLLKIVGKGLAAFVNRADASYYHGWAVSLADEQAYQPAMMFGPLTYVLIPRLLWPGKPRILTGTDYSGLLFGQQYIAWSNSSTGAGLYPALYLGFGWPTLIVGALLTGAFLAFTTRLALRWGGSLAAGLYMFSMLPFMLRMNEVWPVGALAGPVINLVYVLVFVTAARIIVRVAISTRSTPVLAQ